MPTATPTPVPLPEVCLRQQFADDVQACHAAPSYDIELVVDPASARVTGLQTIAYTNAEDEPLDTVYLGLLPSSPSYGGAMTVTQLLRGTDPIMPLAEPEGSALRVALEPPLAPDRLLKLTMDFVVDVPTSGAFGHALFLCSTRAPSTSMHKLRERVGDTAFFGVLRTYYVRHRYQIATSQSFPDTVEEIAGDPHLDLYDTWIGGSSEQ
jgi:hypothetical protein